MTTIKTDITLFNLIQIQELKNRSKGVIIKEGDRVYYISEVMKGGFKEK